MMIKLEEFLETASADNTLALEEAKAYTASHGKMVSADVMTMLLVQSALYGRFKDVSEDGSHPARDMCLAFMDRIRTQSQFNFQADHPKGQANIEMVDMLIDDLMSEDAIGLTSLKNMAMAEASESTRPFKYATLSDILAIRQPSVEEEVSYPSETYLISTALQGADVTISLADPAVADIKFEVFLETCADTNEQDVPESFIRYPMSVGYVNIKAGDTDGFLALGARKVRTYNKFFIKPSYSVTFEASVRNNRG